MNDIFAARYENEFFELMGHLATSMEASFPECPCTKEWALFVRNVVLPSPQERARSLETYLSNLETPLLKGCAKYSRAVQSLTNSSATVYHALQYKDVAAANASCDIFADLDLPAKLQVMQEKNTVDVFWDYVHEMNTKCFQAKRKPKPPVPSVQDISEDIRRRKLPKGAAGGGGGGASGESSSEMLKGLHEVWCRLCDARALPSPVAPDDTVRTRLSAIAAGVEGDFEAACMSKRQEMQERIFQAFPELCKDNDKDLGETEWTLLVKAVGLLHMHEHIPGNMMRSIENVAQKIAQDITSGTSDLSSLNLEEIGNQVLANVNPADVSAFAKNIDSILPALQRMTK